MRVRLTRIIFAVVLAAVVTLPLYNVFSIYPSFTHLLLIHSTEDEAERLARHLITHLFGDLTEDLSNHLRQRAGEIKTHEMIEKTLEDFKVYKLRIFAASGEILYSSEAKEVGEINHEPYFHSIVATGKTFSQTVEKDSRSAEGQKIPVSVFETYVPIMSDGRFVGALETYYDISVRRDELHALIQRNSLLLAVVGLISIVLVVLFYRTHFSLLRAEKKLQELNAGLEERVRQEVQKGRQQERILVQQSRHAAMGEMIGAIAHQWRQPLSALGLIVQDLHDAQRHNELDDAYLNDSVKRAMRQIDFMSKTIDDFRNFFRPEKEKAPFDVSRAVAEVVRMLSATLKRQQIDCVLRCCNGSHTATDWVEVPGCPNAVFSGYRNEFGQALINIVNNARDAILERREKGELVPDERGIIVIAVESASDRIRIRVSDNGGGIDEKILPRIFDPYFSTKDEGKGTGIGLYMTRVIIEDNMGGEIAVESTGQGSSFIITLPRVEG